jgi:hypothetical protein
MKSLHGMLVKGEQCDHESPSSRFPGCPLLHACREQHPTCASPVKNWALFITTVVTDFRLQEGSGEGDSLLPYNTDRVPSSLPTGLQENP